MVPDIVSYSSEIYIIPHHKKLPYHDVWGIIFANLNARHESTDSQHCYVIDRMLLAHLVHWFRILRHTKLGIFRIPPHKPHPNLVVWAGSCFQIELHYTKLHLLITATDLLLVCFAFIHIHKQLVYFN